MEGNLRLKIGWATFQWKGNLPFLLCFTLYSGANSKYKPPGGLFSEGRFNGGFFALRFWGAYTWRGLFSEFYGIMRPWILLFVVLKTTIFGLHPSNDLE